MMLYGINKMMLYGINKIMLYGINKMIYGMNKMMLYGINKMILYGINIILYYLFTNINFNPHKITLPSVCNASMTFPPKNIQIKQITVKRYKNVSLKHKFKHLPVPLTVFIKSHDPAMALHITGYRDRKHGFSED